MKQPKPASSLRSKLKEYVEAAYLHGLPCENLHTGELEPPTDISDTEWIVDSILSLLAQEVNKARRYELIEIVGGYHKGAKFQFAGSDPIYTYIKDRIKELERLG